MSYYFLEVNNLDKKIPKVFANKVDSNGNNEKVYHSTESDLNSFSKSPIVKNINQKVNDIFNSSSYIYKADVLITFKDGSVTKRIVGRNSTHLIKMDNELISISYIVDIEKK